MSLALNPLEPVKVIDPIANITEKKDYVILQNGSNVDYKIFTTNSASNSSAQFTCNPPNNKTIVDRLVWMSIDVEIEFAGTVGAGPNLLVDGCDSFRCFPLSNIITTMQATINNTSVSINLNDVLHGMYRFNNDIFDKDLLFSMTPSYPDQSQQYSQLFGSVRNPLGSYSNSVDGISVPRGGFQVGGPANAVFENTPTSAKIITRFVEPLLLSPFTYTKWSSEGFINIQTMSFNFTFDTNLYARIWSHDNVNNPFTLTAGYPVVTLSNPRLMFKYITPLSTSPVPMYKNIEYDYFSIERYPTDVPGVSNGAYVSVSSNNIQLNVIPSKIYLYCRRTNSQLNANFPDTFLPINSISVNFGNRSGLLASASAHQLYQLSRANGLNMSYSEWSGGLLNTNINAVESAYGPGSIICLCPPCDFGLDSIQAPGLLENTQLQINVSVTNTTGSDLSSGDYQLYIVTVSTGIFNINESQTLTQLGVFNRMDILDAKQDKQIDYYDLKDPMGGSFFSKLKTALKKVAPYVKKALPVVKQGLEYAKKYSPEVAQMAAEFGLGRQVRHLREEDYIVEDDMDYDESQFHDAQGRAIVGGVRRKRKLVAKPKPRKRILRGRGMDYDDDFFDECFNDSDDMNGGAVMSRTELLRRIKR